MKAQNFETEVRSYCHSDVQGSQHGDHGFLFRRSFHDVKEQRETRSVMEKEVCGDFSFSVQHHRSSSCRQRISLAAAEDPVALSRIYFMKL